MDGSRSSAIPSSMRTSEARVVFNNGKYRRFARKVICPASAYSIPATPRISSSGGPSNRHPSFCATSASFMEELLNSLWGCLRVSHRLKREVQPARLLLVEKAGLGRRGGGRRVGPAEGYGLQDRNFGK